MRLGKSWLSDRHMQFMDLIQATGGWLGPGSSWFRYGVNKGGPGTPVWLVQNVA